MAASTPAPATFSSADLEGSWLYCDGPSLLDTEVSFEGDRFNTYIDGRPGLSGDYAAEGGDLVVGESRYAAVLSGPVLALVSDDGGAVYARTASACPPGAKAPPVSMGSESEQGSPELSTILDIARAEVRKSGLPGEVAFQDPWLRQSGDWAFLEAEFRRPNGEFIYDTDPDYCGFDATVQLLLRRANGSWSVESGEGVQRGAEEEGQYCISDVPDYSPYVDDFGAPRSIFPDLPY
ncbi:hypothetical protein [Rubrivirga sp.]|uniref:hypothetical protein n=1 Tax=Rubrivirga sp. TaxID=1885344 RepID=UPI003C70A3CB